MNHFINLGALHPNSIDEDILNLIDEVDLEQELKEIGEALADVDKFPGYVREKSSKAISNFLVSESIHPIFAQNCDLYSSYNSFAYFQNVNDKIGLST